MQKPIALPLEHPELTVELSGGLIRRTVHPSGLRVLTEHMPGARSASIGFWVGVGSRDEQAERGDAPASLGSTHFLEHLLFKGTPSFDAYGIATAFDKMGAEHNAMTAKEYTCYHAKVRDANVEEATRMLADMVTNSLIEEGEFETERGVILEELAMASDDLADVAGERFFEVVMGDHPLGRPIGGNPETIKAARRDDVMAHYLEAYRAGTLVVTAAGAVDHDEFVELVARSLEAASDARWHTRESGAPAPRRSRERRAGGAEQGLNAAEARETFVTEKPGEQVHLMIGGPGFQAGAPERFAYGIMNSVLGGGMSSRLFQEIREKRGLAYTAYAFGASYSDAGLFGMYAACAPENAAQVVQVAHEELERVAAEGVTEEEFERTLGQLAGSSALALEDSDTRMGRLAKAELGTGELWDLDTSLEHFATVTHDEVKRVAAQLAAQSRFTVAVGETSRTTL
ncbi:MAG: M16 family metallopeptidase [Microbacteriaceae bacterium]